MSNDAPKLLLTAPEAARALAVSPRTLWTLTQTGEIPAVRIGPRSVRYAVADLEAAIQRMRARAPGEQDMGGPAHA